MDGGLLLIPGRVIAFTVEGLPKGKERPRARILPGKRGQKPRATIYTPSSTKSFEASVKRVVLQAMKGKAPIEGPVKVAILIGMPIAKSWTKTRKAEVRKGLIAHTSKPDIDNVTKAVLDGMVINDKTPDQVTHHRGVMQDDNQIVKLTVLKDFVDEPRVSVRVTELVVPEKIPVTQADMCPAPSRDQGLGKNGEAASQEVKSVRPVSDDNGAQVSQSRQPKSDTDGEPARAQCGFDGLARDCPNHAIKGAPWCDACRPPGKRK